MKDKTSLLVFLFYSFSFILFSVLFMRSLIVYEVSLESVLHSSEYCLLISFFPKLPTLSYIFLFLSVFFLLGVCCSVIEIFINKRSYLIEGNLNE